MGNERTVKKSGVGVKRQYDSLCSSIGEKPTRVKA
jgi:hypothetical protein